MVWLRKGETGLKIEQSPRMRMTRRKKDVPPTQPRRQRRPNAFLKFFSKEEGSRYPRRSLA